MVDFYWGDYYGMGGLNGRLLWEGGGGEINFLLIGKNKTIFNHIVTHF